MEQEREDIREIIGIFRKLYLKYGFDSLAKAILLFGAGLDYSLYKEEVWSALEEAYGIYRSHEVDTYLSERFTEILDKVSE